MKNKRDLTQKIRDPTNVCTMKAKTDLTQKISDPTNACTMTAKRDLTQKIRDPNGLVKSFTITKHAIEPRTKAKEGLK